MVLNIFRRFLPKYLHGNFVSANIHTMLEVEDINKYTDPYLYKIFPLIIKYAKDDDVEKIIFECFDLLSCDMELMCRYMANYSCKEFLVHLLLFDIWDYKLTLKKHQILSLLREVLITHLNSIGACYCNYYFPAEIDDNEPKIKQPINLKPPQKSPKELKDLIFSINKVYNADNLKDFEITNILHEIIYNYSKNHFYYVLRDECIWKIEIRYNVEYKVEKAIIGEISQYNLINRDREPCLIDVKTGLEIGIGRQIKTPFIKNGNTIQKTIAEIQNKRIGIWNKYNDTLKKYEKEGIIQLPYIPEYATNNAHMYYIIMPSEEVRSEFINYMKQDDIATPFHYIPLHLSTVGKKMGYKEGDLPVTEEYANRLVRLPLYADMTNEEVDKVILKLNKFFDKK